MHVFLQNFSLLMIAVEMDSPQLKFPISLTVNANSQPCNFHYIDVATKSSVTYTSRDNGQT